MRSGFTLKLYPLAVMKLFVLEMLCAGLLCAACLCDYRQEVDSALYMN
jgi:hypothetical protein